MARGPSRDQLGKASGRRCGFDRCCNRRGGVIFAVNQRQRRIIVALSLVTTNSCPLGSRFSRNLRPPDKERSSLPAVKSIAFGRQVPHAPFCTAEKSLVVARIKVSPILLTAGPSLAMPSWSSAYWGVLPPCVDASAVTATAETSRSILASHAPQKGPCMQARRGCRSPLEL